MQVIFFIDFSVHISLMYVCVHYSSDFSVSVASSPVSLKVGMLIEEMQINGTAASQMP